jgi:hypothetical protein
MRTNPSSWAWLWVLLAVLGGVGGGIYYYKAKGFAPGAIGTDPPSDSAPVRDSLPAATPPSAQMPPAPADTSSAPGGTTLPPVRDSSPARLTPPAEASDSTYVTGPVDSGGIRLVGLPRGSTVLIDEKPIAQALTRLAPGPHALAISAPRYNFYSDTVVIRPGQIQELTPQLTQLGAPTPSARSERRANATCVPGAGYNTDGSCFDDRPKPVNPPFVTVPEDAKAAPRPSLLWVKVSAEGRTVDLRRLRPSDDPAYESEVLNFVWTVTWHPALKDGAPVEAWTQMLFPPAQEQ